jgi:hypothetical protein
MPWGEKAADCLPRGAGTRCIAFIKAHLCLRRPRLSTPKPRHAGAGSTRSRAISDRISWSGYVTLTGSRDVGSRVRVTAWLCSAIPDIVSRPRSYSTRFGFIYGRSPRGKGFSGETINRLQLSIRPLMQLVLLASMRSADRRPITLAGICGPMEAARLADPGPTGCHHNFVRPRTAETEAASVYAAAR